MDITSDEKISKLLRHIAEILAKKWINLLKNRKENDNLKK
jgi:hypothetical protein